MLKRDLLIVFSILISMTIIVRAEQSDVMPPRVMIEAMLVEFYSSEREIDKLEIDWEMPVESGSSEIDKVFRARTADNDSIGVEKWETLKNKLQSNKIGVNILQAPRLATIDKEQGAIKIVRDVHYMEKVEDNLYRLKTLKNIGTTFTATPIIEDDIIHTTFNLQVNEMRERQVLPEAPDLNIGPPIITSQQISTTIDVKNGETMVVGGLSGTDSEKEGSDTLVFITANIIP